IPLQIPFHALFKPGYMQKHTYQITCRRKVLTEYFYENPEHFSIASQNLNIFADYDGAKELTELLTIYVKEGIERGEYCLWFSPNILTVEKIKNKLREAGVDAEHSLDSSQLEILPANLSPENITLFASTIKELIGE